MTVEKINLESLNYDDVVLLPQWSNIGSRDEIELFNYYDDGIFIPIFSSPMLGISEVDLVIAILKKGGIGILHRFFNSMEERYSAVDKIANEVNFFGVAVGIHDWDQEIKFIEYSHDRGCKFVCVDTASAYLQKTIDFVRKLSEYKKSNKLDFEIIAGNVVDVLGCFYLADAGADWIRCGIGIGSLCTTTKHHAIGCPSLTTIMECSKIKIQFPDVKIIMDGGISNSGQALKAFAFGADAIMVGSLFGHSLESHNNGVLIGMSSYALQDKMGKIRKSNEGTITLVPENEIKPFDEIWNEFTYGLKSGLSYLGCKKLQNLHDIEVEYIKVK